jgi:hypothetical protein
MMRRLFHSLLLTAVVLVPAAVSAQSSSELVTRTITLEYLTPSDAARLVAPYVQSAKGGAYSAGEGVRAITVRETPARLAEIESIIRTQDHAPSRQAVRLHFQLIRADSSSQRDTRIADVDSIVRQLLGVSGLHLEGEALAQVDEGAEFHVGLPKTFSIQGACRAISSGPNGRVRINVTLERPKARMFQAEPSKETLIGTGLTIPYGRNVVLGTTTSDGAVYVLSVQAERVPERP